MRLNIVPSLIIILIGSGCDFLFSPDKTAPTIQSVYPKDGMIDVPVTTPVTVVFSEPVNPATIHSRTFMVVVGDNVVPGLIDVDEAVITFEPLTAYACRTLYTALLTPGISDLAGNTLGAPYEWSFTTALDTSCSWTLGEGYYLTEVAVDVTGVYVMGYTENPDYSTYRTDFFAAKFSVDGKKQWFEEVVTENWDSPGGMAIYGGYVYMARWEDPTGLGDASVYIDKRETQTGTLVWSTLVEPTGRIGEVAVGADGIYAVGVNRVAGFIAQLDWATGSVVRKVIIHGSATSVAYGDGVVYVGGNTNGSLGGSNAGYGDLFVIAYSMNLDQTWALQYGTEKDEHGGYVAVTSTKLFLVGNSGNILQGDPIKPVVLAYNLTGDTLQWSRTDSELPGSLVKAATDSRGNLYISKGGKPHSEGAGLLKLAPDDGTVLWQQRVTSFRALSRIVVAGGVIFAVNESERVLRYNAETGNPY